MTTSVGVRGIRMNTMRNLICSAQDVPVSNTPIYQNGDMLSSHGDRANVVDSCACLESDPLTGSKARRGVGKYPVLENSLERTLHCV